MFVPSLTLVRGMARRVSQIKNAPIPMQPRLRRSAAKPVSMDIKKQTITGGDQEIVVNRKTAGHHYNDSEKSLEHTFASLKIRDDVMKGLETLSIGQPTIVQLLAIPQVMERKNIFCAAQTGSGKTLVYVASIISMLKNETDEGYISRLSRPRAVVVAPSRELVLQILKVFKSISYYAPFRSVGLLGFGDQKWKRDYLKGLVDIVITTPETLIKYNMKGKLILSDLKYLVIDEADTLFDENFRRTTKELLNICHFTEENDSSSVQCILAAATLPPKNILSGYKKFIPKLELCQSNLHKVLPNIKHTFVKTIQNKKIELLIKRLENISTKKSQKCMIFCNTTKSCNWLSMKLKEKGYAHAIIHGNIEPQKRLAEFEQFVDGENNMLLCTDIASRGLDITDVSLVINFDCPFNPTDYIHRSGRTGRATEVFTNKGEVLTFITKNKEVSFAEKVQTAVGKNQSLGAITNKENPSKIKYMKAIRQRSEEELKVKQQNLKLKKIEKDQKARKAEVKSLLKKAKNS